MQSKNLKNDYKKIKDSNNRSGQGRKVMQFFDQLDAVLAVRDATRPPQVLEKANAEVRALIGFWGDSRIQAELDGGAKKQDIEEGFKSREDDRRDYGKVY